MPPAAGHANEDRDLVDAAGVEHLDCVISRVGGRELGGRQREHPRDIERDVAAADDHRVLGPQVKLQPAVVRMPVVPGDELGRGVRAAQALTGDPEPLVGRCTDRVEDEVIVLEQLLARDIGTQLDMTEEAEPIVLGRLGEGSRHRLDLRVIRRDARPHETVRGR
jgi:hypothetical protein